ncbi:MAG TPA: undecaprenyl-diphosphate phosphatase [Pyrinomonadaceae bacterium]|nr:undecaprenyl-diphosphate phosphatase [Pyrinomonadaceae bacterium]
MNTYFLSVLLGIIEGLTEFLPVSSTAHLRIAEALFQFDLHDSFWKMYTIVIQLGATLAIPVYFWDRIMHFIRTFPRGERGDRTVLTHPLALTLLAFVVTAGPAFMLKKQIGQNLENLHVMAWALLLGGIIMWIVDSTFRKPRIMHMEEMGLWQAVCVGAAQILAPLFPGTSRSMCTIAAGQVVGMSRQAALEFSFFLSIPTMIAGTSYDLLKTLSGNYRPAAEGNLAPLVISGHQWIVLAIGFIVSFIVAFAVVAWFMHWVRKHGFIPFAIYRIALGIVIFVLLARGSI